MAFNYTEVIVYCSFTRYKDSASERHCAREFEAVWYKNQGKYLYQSTAFEDLEEDREIIFTYAIVAVYFTTFESVVFCFFFHVKTFHQKNTTAELKIDNKRRQVKCKYMYKK